MIHCLNCMQIELISDMKFVYRKSNNGKKRMKKLLQHLLITLNVLSNFDNCLWAVLCNIHCIEQLVRLWEVMQKQKYTWWTLQVLNNYFIHYLNL